MPHPQVQKALNFIVNFIKQTTLTHKKKLIALVVISILIYLAKKKLRLQHILKLAEQLTRILSYLPLPQFPTYRQINRYQSPRLNTLASQIIAVMKVDTLTDGIRKKTSSWDDLKTSIFAGTILSLSLFNIQSFYFIVQNKYEKDFIELQAIQTFDQLMGNLRKKFVTQIPNTFQSLIHLLSNLILSINVRQQASIDDIFHILDSMLQTLFAKTFLLKKQSNQHISKSIYKNQEPYNVAKNYFTTPLNYIPKKKSPLSTVFSKVSSLASRFSFSILKEPVCETSLQRFDWVRPAYQIPLKKSPVDNLKWPNRQSQLLSKLVLSEIDQILTSINFSTLLYQNAIYNLTVLKNRLFLYFSKKGVQKLKIAEVLPVVYKLLKEEVLVPGTHGGLKEGEQDKRTKFYEAQIMKAIRHKNISSSIENSQSQLLIKSEPSQILPIQQPLNGLASNPELILLNMHLEEIYQSRELSHLVRQFQIKYFNERSGVTLNPTQRKSNEEDEIKKLLSMLGDNEELNKRQNQRENQT